jgi:hypothetical protein
MKIDRPTFGVNIESNNDYNWEAERLDDGLKKRSLDIRFLEFDEGGRAKELHKEPKPGYSFIMSPFGPTYTWMTSVITEVISFSEEFMHFKTRNSEYKVNKLNSTQ